MDQYDLRPDPCDNQIVRLTNCLQLLACFCDIAAIFVRELRQLAHVLDMIANCVFYSTVGCMASQVNNEIDYRRKTQQEYSNLSNSEVIGEGTMATPILREARIVEENNQKDKRYDTY
jgi:hypothetical protein